MKTLLALITVFFMTLGSQLVAQTLPKTGAIIRPEVNAVALVKGETSSIELSIVRSKMERKTEFDTPVIQEIEGLEVSIEPTEITDRYVLTLTPTDVPAGEYLLILKGAGVNRRYLTSAMLSVKVTSGESFAVDTN